MRCKEFCSERCEQDEESVAISRSYFGPFGEMNPLISDFFSPAIPVRYCKSEDWRLHHFQMYSSYHLTCGMRIVLSRLFEFTFYRSVSKVFTPT